MHGLVAVNRALRPLTPFVTWRDKRCAPPALGTGIMSDWRRRKVKGIWRALTIPGYVIARRTGRCVVDATFRAAMGPERALARFARWIPEEIDAALLGDNQAGVYAALKLKPAAAVANVGTSGQLSRVVTARIAAAVKAFLDVVQCAFRAGGALARAFARLIALVVSDKLKRRKRRPNVRAVKRRPKPYRLLMKPRSQYTPEECV